MPSPAFWLNLPLPGAGLVVRGRIGAGLALLVPALLVATGLVLAGLVATTAFAASVRGLLLGGYALLALIALAVHWLALERTRAADPEAVRRLHREAAAAYLGDRHAEAVAAASRLARAAPAEPGAWQLLGMVAEAAGDTPGAARARRRARRLLSEREP